LANICGEKKPWFEESFGLGASVLLSTEAAGKGSHPDYFILSYRHDKTGRAAYAPKIRLKIVLPPCSRGLSGGSWGTRTALPPKLILTPLTYLRLRLWQPMGWPGESHTQIYTQSKERGLGLMTQTPLKYLTLLGAGGRTRTGTRLPSGDFESPASTNSTTPAACLL
jgi:hypothetical protein